MSAPISDVLRDLAATHSLSYLSLCIHARDDGTMYLDASAQGGGQCAFSSLTSDDDRTPQAVIQSAIEGLNAKRVKLVAVPELEAA